MRLRERGKSNLPINSATSFQSPSTRGTITPHNVRLLLSILFGPGDWLSLAAQALDCSPRFVRMVLQGTRVMPRKWLVVMRAVSEHRRENLDRRLRAQRHEAVDRVIDAHLAKWPSMQQELDRLWEAARQARIREGFKDLP